jgi:phosphodiesterase/alkaline phosphatase D-like protein
MITHWWLGDPDTGAVKLGARSNANGSLTLSCAYGSQTLTADTAVSDGVVEFSLAGLPSGQSIPATLTDTNGASTPITLKTLPSGGPYKVTWGSCWERRRGNSIMAKTVAMNPHLFISLGDMPYCNQWATDAWGEQMSGGIESSLANNSDVSVYYKGHRQHRNEPELRRLLQSVPLWYMPDDHEWHFDNASCGTDALSAWQSTVTGAAGQTYTVMQAGEAAAKAAITAYTKGNPVNSDAGIDADAKYFRRRIGPAEFFVIDCIRYRTVPSATDNASKTMLGATQKAWLIDGINNSTATFKVIVTPKQFWRGAGNSDTWAPSGGNYQTELLEILWAIRNTTGVFAIAGDQHKPSAQYAAPDALGAGYPAMLCVVACPTGITYNPDGAVTGYPANVAWKAGGQADFCLDDHVVGVLDIYDTHVDISIQSELRGRVWAGQLHAGSNALVYPAKGLA